MFGAIGKYLSQMEIECTGACDVSALQNYLIEADADESVSAVVLHVNSPGGTVTGIPEVASVIAGMVKPIVAYCDSMMASAAYWIGSGCDEILVSSTADVGSIGVFQAWVDPSKNMEKNGFELKVIRAGTHKAAWLPGMMDDESFALMQAQVDSVYAMFSSHVVAMRGAIASEVMQGQSFLGETAVVVGLADQVVNGIGDAIERARTLSTGESNEIS
jgi:signal peptide peptidase SppA